MEVSQVIKETGILPPVGWKPWRVLSMVTWSEAHFITITLAPMLRIMKAGLIRICLFGISRHCFSPAILPSSFLQWSSSPSHFRMFEYQFREESPCLGHVLWLGWKMEEQDWDAFRVIWKRKVLQRREIKGTLDRQTNRPTVTLVSCRSHSFPQRLKIFPASLPFLFLPD